MPELERRAKWASDYFKIQLPGLHARAGRLVELKVETAREGVEVRLNGQPTLVISRAELSAPPGDEAFRRMLEQRWRSWRAEHETLLRS